MLFVYLVNKILIPVEGENPQNFSFHFFCLIPAEIHKIFYVIKLRCIPVLLVL